MWQIRKPAPVETNDPTSGIKYPLGLFDRTIVDPPALVASTFRGATFTERASARAGTSRYRSIASAVGIAKLPEGLVGYAPAEERVDHIVVPVETSHDGLG